MISEDDLDPEKNSRDALITLAIMVAMWILTLFAPLILKLDGIGTAP